MSRPEEAVEIERGFDADPLEALGEPGVRPAAAALMQELEIVPFRVHLARRRQVLDLGIRMDEVQERVPVAPQIEVPRGRDALDQGDGAQFLDEAGVEADLVDAVDDVAGAARRFFAPDRVDLDDDDVGRVRVGEQRIERGVAAEAAVPVFLAVDLDGGVHLRQAGRGEHGVDGEVSGTENLGLAGAHVRRGDMDLEVLAGVDAGEIHLFLKQIPQRVRARRIELVGREGAAQALEEQVARRAVETEPAHQAVEGLRWIGENRAASLTAFQKS